MIYSIAAITFFISTFILLLIENKAYQKIDTVQNSAGLRLSPRFVGLLVLFFFVFTAEYLPQPLTPTYLGDIHHLSLSQIGQLGSIASLGNVFMALILGGIKGTWDFYSARLLCVVLRF